MSKKTKKQMNKYSKYKFSGIEWIGDIPEHWEVVRLKYSLDALESGSRQTGGGNQLSDGVFSLGGEHIGWFGELLLNNAKYISETYFENLNTGKIFKNDVLLVKDGATIGKVAIADNIPFEKCAVNEHVFILRSNSNFSYKYLFFFIWCYIGQEQIQQNIKGSAQPGLNSNFINEVFIPFPPLPEQTAIANYLDKKTALIDELITKKERLIELLEEEKIAVINEAVTGKAPITKSQTTKYKDSGIEWLGKIPEHWEVIRLASIGVFSKGKGISRSELEESGLPAILYGDIYTKYSIKAESIKQYISKETAQTSVKIQTGDLLFTGSGETKEDIGKCIVYVGNEVVYAGGDIIIFKQSKHNSLFLSYLLNSNGAIYQKARMGKGEIVVHIYSSNLREIVLPLPTNKSEQTQIVNYIEKETSRIEKTIEKTKKLIELLKEYRTALISEVVTGKVKVN